MQNNNHNDNDSKNENEDELISSDDRQVSKGKTTVASDLVSDASYKHDNKAQTVVKRST